jgi:peptidoglycan hydrolase-like protein with peptidoglycan-binding domain/3D (Asp-Asp-Asp) domain-containing protein
MHKIKIPKHILFIIVAIAVVSPTFARGRIATEPFHQEFSITAYYSPLPDQCCYIKGGLKADKILNGEGHTTADGTPVFKGIVAAPKSYPFGTRIKLPGIGVVEVRDRGGAINELGSGVHRLDIWVGAGEEGLARALAFGEVRLTGRVFPPEVDQPAIALDFAKLPVSWERLRVYVTEEMGLLALDPASGDLSLSTVLLQEKLHDLGYFRHAVTGLFGPVTRRALRLFLSDAGLAESTSVLTRKTSAHLLAAMRKKDIKKYIPFISRSSRHNEIRVAQGILRHLGYYRGRTSGVYDDNLFGAILRFQQDHGLVGTADDPGAGRIGPITQRTLQHEWWKKEVGELAKRYELFGDVAQTLRKRGQRISQFLTVGYTGKSVRVLQNLLSEKGYFPHEKINGVFGPMTQYAVEQFQIAEGLIKNSSDKAAGYVGPATLRRLQRSTAIDAYKKVRGHGFHVL